jgi:hypothetical protein
MRPQTLLLSCFAAAWVACTGDILLPGEAGSFGGDPQNPNDPNADLPRTPPVAVASSRFPRLTHKQWEATVRDLLGLPAVPGLSSTFTTDPLGTSHFDNDEAVLVVTSGLWADYARAAEQLSTTATATAAAMAAFVPQGLPTDPTLQARAFITQFGKRAFRRPLTSTEVDSYAALFAQGTTLTGVTDAFTAGVRITLQAMLQSPHFVYRVEASSGAPGQDIALNGYEVATRLSYALLGTMPTPALTVAAETGQLDTADGVGQQAQLLLVDPRSHDVVAEFHRQLFRVQNYANIQKDSTVFPEFTPQTPAALQREHELFVESVAFTDVRGLTELLTAPYTFVNKVNAPLYGLAATAYGDAFQRVALDPTRRRGILSQAGFLSYFGTATLQNTILRGAFVNLSVLCANLPPPPAAIPPLPPLQPGMTNRQRIEAHTGPGTCGATCHGTMINPIGFGLENFDGAGRYQTLDNGKTIDASGTYSFDGVAKSYNGVKEMTDLISQSVQTHRCYAQNQVEFVLGRKHQPADLSLVELQGHTSRIGGSLQSLLVALVSSTPFRSRASEVNP